MNTSTILAKEEEHHFKLEKACTKISNH